MLSLLAAFALAQDPGQEYSAKLIELTEPGGAPARIQIHVSNERLKTPKVSPKHQWVFEWAAAGLGRREEQRAFTPRVRVFSQQRKSQNDPAERVARMTMRMWDFLVRKLRWEHNPGANMGIVDFYLCFGGKAGGEQLWDYDKDGEREIRVNTIYIYAVQTFTDPLEMAREVAHEYGHATLPPVGGFKEPEDWANGYLGERLYLKWLHDDMASGRLGPEDAMGATASDLEAYLKKNVNPLVDAAALNGPDVLLLAKPGAKAMAHYLGLVMYAEAILPTSAFERSLKVMGSTAAMDYPKALVLAAGEPANYLLTVPQRFQNRPIWIPLGKGKLTGQIGIVKRQGDWALVNAGSTAIRIANPPPADPPTQ